MDLMPVYDSTALSKTKKYQINGYRYRFFCTDTSRRIGCEQFLFKPFAGQRVKATLTISRKQLSRKVSEIVGVIHQEVKEPEVNQPGLF